MGTQAGSLWGQISSHGPSGKSSNVKPPHVSPELQHSSASYPLLSPHHRRTTLIAGIGIGVGTVIRSLKYEPLRLSVLGLESGHHTVRSITNYHTSWACRISYTIHRSRLVFGRAGVIPAPTFTVNSALTYTVEQERENKQCLKKKYRWK